VATLCDDAGVNDSAEPRPTDEITRARLAAIVDSSDDAIISKTREGVITSWNAAAERMFGYTEAEAIGQNITLLIPDDRLDEERRVLSSIVRGERVRHFETVRRAKDGRLLDISLTVSPIKDASGRVVGASKVARDITERRRAEAHLATTITTLEALYRLVDSVGRAKDLAGVCEAAIDAVMTVGADRASVLTFDEAGVMRFRAWRNLSDAYRAAVDGHAPWSRDVADPPPVVVEDVRADPSLGPLRDVIATEGIRALAFVPLVNQGRLLGKFMVYYDAAHVFTAAETRLAANIAQHVAFGLARVLADAAMDDLLVREQAVRREADAARVEAEGRRAVAEELAIENARLYEEARRRQREAEFVADVAQRVNESLDLQTTLEHLVEGARELCGGDIARIVVRDLDDGRMRLRHQIGTRWDGHHDQVTIEPGQGSGGVVLLTGTPFRTEHYADDPRIGAPDGVSRAEDGTVAQMVVPIPGEAGIAGLLYVDRRERRPFTDGDEAVLLRLARHAGTAIRNSQLFAAERAARAEADTANRGKDQFLAVLSHELRTPLNAILGWARMLRGRRLDDRQRAHAVEVIERNADLQGQLIADLLDVSRFVAGKMEIEREPVDLVLVARQAVEGVTNELAARKLAVVVDLDDAAGEVLGDARRLQQVVSNLLLNAIKFTPEGGRVELRLVRSEASARLTVADTGEGIDAAMLKRIFDPFEQADSSTTRAYQGLGLGLAIARQLVDLHGGTIRAESEGKGRGATFTIDLPVLAVRLARPTAGVDTRREGRPPETSLQGCRVLIVDDQSDARELVALALAEAGAEVHVADSAGQALQALAARPIDVLVSDIAMPGMDGYALIQQVRALDRGRSIRAVAVTAHTDRHVRERSLAAGFDACATKPLNAEDLVALLNSVRRR
jgi:PAS domain S-box-containing protein